MKKLMWSIFFLCLFAQINAQVKREAREDSILIKKIETVIVEVMERYDIPGMTVGIVKDNKVIYERAFGIKNIVTKEPLTVNSYFHQASNSKPFTATAIMQFFEKGNVKLDDPIIKYLPYFKMSDERYKTVTIRQMLNHTSGMPDDNDYEWDKPQYDDGALERYVRSLADERLLFNPGEQYSYSNMAYEILGDLISKVSGMTFEDCIQKNILDPLEMNGSTFFKDRVNPELATTPHSWRLKTIVSDNYPYNRAHAPSSTLHSNIPDMCNWAIANLNKGRFKGKQILKPESYDLLWEPPLLSNGSRGQTGLSWFITQIEDVSIISHGGNDEGFLIGFSMIPEKNIAVITMSNADFAFWGRATSKMTSILLGTEPTEERIPVYFQVGKKILDEGLKAGMELFRELKKSNDGRYLFGPGGVLNQIALQLKNLNRIDDAISILKLNTKSFPEHAFTYYQMGVLYEGKGEEKSAKQSYRKALDLNPDFTLAKEALEKLEQKNKLK